MPFRSSPLGIPALLSLFMFFNEICKMYNLQGCSRFYLLVLFSCYHIVLSNFNAGSFNEIKPSKQFFNYIAYQGCRGPYVIKKKQCDSLSLLPLKISKIGVPFDPLGDVHILRRQNFWIFLPLPPYQQTVYLMKLMYLCRHLLNPSLPLLCLHKM